MADGSHTHDITDQRLTTLEANTKILADAVNALAVAKADKDHGHAAYSPSGHMHDAAYAAKDHVHSNLPSIPGMPKLVFYDDYMDRTIVRGQFIANPKGSYLGAILTSDGKYLVNAWATTNGGGLYDGKQIEIANGVMDILVETRMAIFPDGTTKPAPVIAGFKPVADGADLSRNGAITGPFAMEFRLRADSLFGYKGVPMLWTGRNWKAEPAPGYTFGKSDDVKYADGEIDIVEGNFDKQPAVFIHHSWVKPTDSAAIQQAYFLSPAGTTWQAWHTYRVVFYPSGIVGSTWTPSVEVWQDGVSLGKVTDKVPGNYPFRPNFQFEPSLVSTVPPATTKGHIQIDYIAIWTP